MSNADFHAKYRAHKAHMEAVPGALAAARDAARRPEGVPADWQATLAAAHLDTLVAEVERLTAALLQARKDAAEEQREFQREARDIAAEARWEGQQGGDYGSY